MAARPGAPDRCVIVVLGSPNDEHGNLSSMARERLTLAAESYFRRPESHMLLTGGFGAHFNASPRPHAEHARSFLVALGVPESTFADFALSNNTIEDALLALPIVEDLCARRLLVVTSGFHVPRARYLFGRVFPDLEIGYAAASHAADASVLDGLIEHEERALARLRALQDGPDDPLASALHRSRERS